MANKNKINRNSKNKDSGSKKKSKTTPTTRFNVDDPVNDIHDDDIFGDDLVIAKENPDEEVFEKPW